ncbi:hypothetical protein B484DRAFT_232095 [Ochromonadaceae sp. CCMP2298]|nr:hypothetical protein B484DRAFT_232095 [Ochromonadaceae sp. CCMP2298]
MSLVRAVVVGVVLGCSLYACYMLMMGPTPMSIGQSRVPRTDQAQVQQQQMEQTKLGRKQAEQLARQGDLGEPGNRGGTGSTGGTGAGSSGAGGNEGGKGAGDRVTGRWAQWNGTQAQRQKQG